MAEAGGTARILASAAVLLALPLHALPLRAAALECADMQKPLDAFELTFDQVTKKPGEAAVTVVLTSQQRRTGAESVTYLGVAPNFTRVRLRNSIFVLETFNPTTGAVLTGSHSVDTGKDYLGLQQPVDFVVTMKNDKGAVDSTIRSKVTFGGRAGMTLGGCALDLVKVTRTNVGTRGGKPFDATSELWYSQALKTSLYSRTSSKDGTVAVLRARGISDTFASAQ